MPHDLATFLAPGDLMNFCRLGFFMYWQRQGLCSLIFTQQAALGLLDDMMAVAQGLSCSGLQVTAFDTSALLRSSTMKKSAHTAWLATLLPLIMFLYFVSLCLGQVWEYMWFYISIYRSGMVV